MNINKIYVAVERHRMSHCRPIKRAHLAFIPGKFAIIQIFCQICHFFHVISRVLFVSIHPRKSSEFTFYQSHFRHKFALIISKPGKWWKRFHLWIISFRSFNSYFSYLALFKCFNGKITWKCSANQILIWLLVI